MISCFAACVSAYASVGALIAGGKTEQVFNTIAQVAGIVALVTGSLSAVGNMAKAADPTNMLSMNSYVDNAGKTVIDLDPIVLGETAKDFGGFGALGDAARGAAEAIRAGKMAYNSLISSGVAAGSVAISSVLSFSSLASSSMPAGSHSIVASITNTALGDYTRYGNLRFKAGPTLSKSGFSFVKRLGNNKFFYPNSTKFGTAAKSFGVPIAKSLGTALNVAGTASDVGTLANSINTKAGTMTYLHDGALITADAASFFPPTRLAAPAAHAWDIATKEAANWVWSKVYGVH